MFVAIDMDIVTSIWSPTKTELLTEWSDVLVMAEAACWNQTHRAVIPWYCEKDCFARTFSDLTTLSHRFGSTSTSILLCQLRHIWSWWVNHLGYFLKRLRRPCLHNLITVITHDFQRAAGIGSTSSQQLQSLRTVHVLLWKVSSILVTNKFPAARKCLTYSYHMPLKLLLASMLLLIVKKFYAPKLQC